MISDCKLLYWKKMDMINIIEIMVFFGVVDLSGLQMTNVYY